MQVPPSPANQPPQSQAATRISSRPNLSQDSGAPARGAVSGGLIAPRPTPVVEARPGALRRFWGSWLRLVAPPLHAYDADAPLMRALQRRRALAAALLFGLTFLWTALVPITLALYPQELVPTLVVIVIGYLTLLVVGWLIRSGRVTGAAIILIALIFAGFLAIQFSFGATHEALERATTFYLLLYPILLAATLMPAESLFITLVADLFLLAASALVIWPPAIRIASIAPAQVANVYVWPLAALVISTVVAYIWTSGMQVATAQAEFAQADAIVLRASEANAHQALQHDVHELMRVVDAWTTGNLGAQVGLLASPELRRVAMALSGYANRVRTLAKDEHTYQRERELAHRLAETILYYRQGAPVTWPAPGGLPADLITLAITTPDPRALLAELNRSTE